MNDALLSLEAKLFVQSCMVVYLEGEAAQLVVAACLVGGGMALEKQS